MTLKEFWATLPLRREFPGRESSINTFEATAGLVGATGELVFLPLLLDSFLLPQDEMMTTERRATPIAANSFATLSWFESLCSFDFKRLPPANHSVDEWYKVTKQAPFQPVLGLDGCRINNQSDNLGRKGRQFL